MGEAGTHAVGSVTDMHGSTSLVEIIAGAKTPETQENMELLKKAQNGDKSAMDEIVIRNGKLVLKYLKKYSWAAEMKEDLLQEGLIGIRKAVDRYNFDYDTAFSTYAMYWIQQSINEYISGNINPLAIPNYIRDRARKIKKMERERENNGLPMLTDGEIADMLGVAEEAVRDARMSAKPVVSFENPIGDDSGATLGDIIPSTDGDMADDLTQKQCMGYLIETIRKKTDEREFKMLEMRYGLGEYERPHTFKEIGDFFGISKQRTEKVMNTLLRRLRNIKEVRDCL